MGLVFSDCANIVKGISQGSLLAFYFLIFLLMICFLSAKCEFCDFADENSLYSCGTNLDNIFTNLKQNM